MKNKIMLAKTYAMTAQKLLEIENIAPSDLQHASLLYRRALRIINRSDEPPRQETLKLYESILKTYALLLNRMGLNLIAEKLTKQFEYRRNDTH